MGMDRRTFCVGPIAAAVFLHGPRSIVEGADEESVLLQKRKIRIGNGSVKRNAQRKCDPGFFDIGHVDLQRLGFVDIPAFPTQFVETTDTLFKLLRRFFQLDQAKKGLTTEYTIDNQTASAFSFLFGDDTSSAGVDAMNVLIQYLESHGAEALEKLSTKILWRSSGLFDATQQDGDGSSAGATLDPRIALAYQSLFGKTPSGSARNTRNEVIRFLNTEEHPEIESLLAQSIGGSEGDAQEAIAGSLTALSLEEPEQWSISWTNFGHVRGHAEPFLDTFASTLTDTDAANAQFWPTIARYGLVFNLLVLQKAKQMQIAGLRSKFQDVWTSELEAAYAGGNLYCIDMSIFENVRPNTVDGFVRFTPATVTLLVQDPVSKTLLPAAIHVAGQSGENAQVYIPSDPAWLYALQAAKTSITVWGIWLGHVYHWHIVTASMQMTMRNNLPRSSQLYLLLRPQSDFLIPFDHVLFLIWPAIAPPTSISTSLQWLELSNDFARNRNYFDDDPRTALARFGIEQEDFTVDTPWDRYPIVKTLLDIWDATEEYITPVVDAIYPDDSSVSNDATLQAWMKCAGSPDEGNIRGLPLMNSKQALCDVLMSLVYRITAHGTSRFDTINPALTFVANYPPCLQDTTIPEPSTSIDTQALLAFLPRTGTIGTFIRFLFIFAFTPPYTPFIPTGGIDSDLFFPGGPGAPLNIALINYRQAVKGIIDTLDPEWKQQYQWPLNIET